MLSGDIDDYESGNGDDDVCQQWMVMVMVMMMYYRGWSDHFESNWGRFIPGSGTGPQWVLMLFLSVEDKFHMLW